MYIDIGAAYFFDLNTSSDMFNWHIHRNVGPVLGYLKSSDPNSFHEILVPMFFSQVKMDKSPQRHMSFVDMNTGRHWVLIIDQSDQGNNPDAVTWACAVRMKTRFVLLFCKLSPVVVTL